MRRQGIRAWFALSICLGVLVLGGVLVGVVGSSGTSVMTDPMFLEEGRTYYLAPPQDTDNTPTITTAAELEGALRTDIDPGLLLEVARWIPNGPGSTLFTCYPLGSSILPTPSCPTCFCWATTNNLSWNAREAIQIRFDIPGPATGGTFVWHGVESPPAVYNLATGLSLVAVPYPPVPGPTNAEELFIELNQLYTVQAIFKLRPDDQFEFYTLTGTSLPPDGWSLLAGEGYVVNVAAGLPPGSPSLNAAALSGTIYRDTLVTNGMLDLGEAPLIARKIVARDSLGNVVTARLSDSAGEYTIRVDPGTYTLEVADLGGETFTASTSCDTVGPNECGVTVGASAVRAGLDFGRDPVEDLSVDLFGEYKSPDTAPCPQVAMSLCARYENRGDFMENNASLRLQLPPSTHIANIGAPVTSNCTFPPSNVQSVVPDSSNLMLFDIAGIGIGDACTVCVEFKVTAPLGAHLLAGGSVYLNHPVQDSVTDSPSQNADAYNRPAVCSYDPNDMQVSPGCGAAGYVEEGESLTYLIRFQNLGNAAATNVVVRDLLVEGLDTTTFSVIDSSHPLSSVALDQNRLLTFSFLGIGLPAAVDDEAGSHGYVRFRIDPVGGLSPGSAIGNSANIVFDNNEPVLTNAVVSTITVPTDTDGVPDPCDNCPADSNPSQSDLDQDGVGDVCDPDSDGDSVDDNLDNCPQMPNPGQGAVALDRAILPANPSTFSWLDQLDVRYVRGDLAGVGTYPVDDSGTLSGELSLVDATIPSAGEAFYYLVRPDCPVGSWQTVVGAEPARDTALP